MVTVQSELPDWVLGGAASNDAQSSIALAQYAPSNEEMEASAEGIDRTDLAGKSMDDLAAEIRDLREDIEQSRKRFLSDFVEIGRRLLEGRQRFMSSGDSDWWSQYMEWAIGEAGVRQANVYNYERVARPENVERIKRQDVDFESASLRAGLEIVQREEAKDRTVKRRSLYIPPEPLPDGIFIEQAAMPALPVGDEMFDLAVFSPPYDLGVKYNLADDNQGYDVYMEHVEQWCVELHRVMGENGRMCVNVPWDVTRGGLKPFAVDWFNRLVKAGFKYKAMILWEEDNVNKTIARGSVDSPNAPHLILRCEVIWVVHKGSWNLGRGDQHNLSDLNTDAGHEFWLKEGTNAQWKFPGAKPLSPDHCPKPFPRELSDRCIKLFSFRNDVVLDPFGGSFTTGESCVYLGRQFYGFDLDPKYIEQGRDRIAAAIQEMRASSRKRK